MKDLIIGSSSQIAQYFPKEGAEFISSRNINIDYINSKQRKRVYICSAEQRTYMTSANFEGYNVIATVDLVDKIKDNADSVIVYSTTELWNKVSGKINLSLQHNFIPSPYIFSKKKMTEIFLNNTEKYSNITILYPFNFNSTYRRGGFLFYKVFDSILNKKRIELGNTYFYRELLHPTYVAKESMSATCHSIIGSGRVTFVNDFIRDLYKYSGMNYDDYVVENIKYLDGQERGINFLDSRKCLYSYDELLTVTLKDIQSYEARK